MNYQHTKSRLVMSLSGASLLFLSAFHSVSANKENIFPEKQLYVFTTDVRTTYAHEITKHLTLLLVTEGLTVKKNFKVVERASRGAQMSLELNSDGQILGAVPLNAMRQHTRESPVEIAKKLLSAAIQSGFLTSASSL